MKSLFSFDGPVYKFCLLVYETFMLNLFWFIGSLPIVTIGVSTSALYYVYEKKLNGYSYSIYNDFIKGYKENFKQALPIGAVITAIVFLSIYNIYILNKMGNDYLWIEYVQVFIVFQILLISVYIFPLIVTFKLKPFELIKNSIFLAYKHIIISIVSVLILIALILFTLFKLSFILFIAALYVFILANFIKKIFGKYTKSEP